LVLSAEQFALAVGSPLFEFALIYIFLVDEQSLLIGSVYIFIALGKEALEELLLCYEDSMQVLYDVGVGAVLEHAPL
jgi:hypothetical protein